MGESIGMRGEICHATARKRSMKIAINLSENTVKIAANKAQRNIKSPFILAKKKIIFFLKGKITLFQLVDVRWDKKKNISNRHTFWRKRNKSWCLISGWAKWISHREILFFKQGRTSLFTRVREGKETPTRKLLLNTEKTYQTLFFITETNSFYSYKKDGKTNSLNSYKKRERK